MTCYLSFIACVLVFGSLIGQTWQASLGGKCNCQPGYELNGTCEGQETPCIPCTEGETYRSFDHYNSTDHLMCKTCLDCSRYNRDTVYKCRTVINAVCGNCWRGFTDGGQSWFDGMWNTCWRADPDPDETATTFAAPTDRAPTDSPVQDENVGKNYRLALIVTGIAAAIILVLLVCVFVRYVHCRRPSPGTSSDSINKNGTAMSGDVTTDSVQTADSAAAADTADDADAADADGATETTPLTPQANQNPNGPNLPCATTSLDPSSMRTDPGKLNQLSQGQLNSHGSSGYSSNLTESKMTKDESPSSQNAQSGPTDPEPPKKSSNDKIQAHLKNAPTNQTQRDISEGRGEGQAYVLECHSCSKHRSYECGVTNNITIHNGFTCSKCQGSASEGQCSTSKEPGRNSTDPPKNTESQDHTDLKEKTKASKTVIAQETEDLSSSSENDLNSQAQSQKQESKGPDPYSVAETEQPGLKLSFA